MRIITPIIFRFGKSKRFKADYNIEEGYDLSIYGFDAEIVYIPGHSKGSIGILTADADLFCGDLLENTNKPRLNPIMDDLKAANASVEKLNKSNIITVYPGHGQQFSIELLRGDSE